MAQKTQEPRTLVLGANGKVGKMLIAAWQGTPACGLELLPVSRDGSTRIRWRTDAPLDVLPGADRVVALWGVTPTSGAAFADNAALAIRAMDVAVAVGADRVLHCSSAAVYAPTADRRALEDDILAPTSAYGAAKRDMEAALTAWRTAHPEGPVPITLRIGNVAGAESLFAAIRKGGRVTIEQFADRRGPQRSYIGPSDLAAVISNLCHAPLAELDPVYNVAARDVTAMADLAKAARRDVAWCPAPRDAIQTVALDTTRLERLCPLPLRSFDAEWLVADWRMWSGEE